MAKPGSLTLAIEESHALARWVALLGISSLAVAALEALHLPAALLLGPLAAGAALAASGAPVRIALGPFAFAQSVVGLMIGRTMTLPIFVEIGRDWPLFLAAIVSVVAGSCLLGLLLTRWRVLPGSTAIWGSFPGAATAMTLMSESFGADVRLVAFMQYLRVVFVAVVASILSWLLAGGHGPAAAAINWFPTVNTVALAQTVGVMLASAIAGLLLRIPAGALVLAIGLSALLQDLGLIRIELPPWLLAISYALVGWSIGQRFTRPILAHAARAFPRIAASILSLIALCGLFAAALVVFAGVDPLTAYLATSPGGADSVAIIAASSRVDVPFVMSLQTGRFLLVLVAGPAIARAVMSLASRRGMSTSAGAVPTAVPDEPGRAILPD